MLRIWGQCDVDLSHRRSQVVDSPSLRDVKLRTLCKSPNGIIQPAGLQLHASCARSPTHQHSRDHGRAPAIGMHRSTEVLQHEPGMIDLHPHGNALQPAQDTGRWMQLLGHQGQRVPASPPVHRLQHPLDSTAVLPVYQDPAREVATASQPLNCASDGRFAAPASQQRCANLFACDARSACWRYPGRSVDGPVNFVGRWWPELRSAWQAASELVGLGLFGNRASQRCARHGWPTHSRATKVPWRLPMEVAGGRDQDGQDHVITHRVRVAAPFAVRPRSRTA